MLALFLFIICDVSNRGIGGQSALAVGRNRHQIKSNPQHICANLLRLTYCTVVVTWSCASVFGRFLTLSPAFRVFEVMIASRSNY
jgi:hypothetical protein